MSTHNDACTHEKLQEIICKVKYDEIFLVQLLGTSDCHIQWVKETCNGNKHKFAETIARYLLKEHKEKATWPNVIEALRKDSVAETVYAEELAAHRRGSATSPGSSFTSCSSWTDSGNTDSLRSFGEARYQKVATHTENNNKTRIKRQFKMLISAICKKLESCDVSVSEVRDIICRYLDNSRKVISRTRHCKRIFDFFRLVSNKPKHNSKPVINYQDYDLIRRLISDVEVDKDCKDKMKLLLCEYISELNGYNLTQELAPQLPYHLNQEYPESMSESESVSPKYTASFCEDLRRKLKICVKITNESLQYVQELWSKIREEFSIPSLTALLYKIAYGSLIISWLIQPSWACCILRKIFTSTEFFQAHLIVKVIIDDICVYDEQSGFPENNVLLSLWLKEASLSGCVEKFREVIVQPGVDINQVLTTDGATPLIIAAQWGHTQLVDCLLDHDADTTPQLSTGQTALHLAASEGFTDIVSLLHCKNKELLGCCDNKNYSALMEAAAGNHDEVIRVLIHQRDEDIDVVEIPSLNEAFLIALTKGHLDSVKILHHCGATTLTEEEERSPLMVATTAGHPHLIDYFLEEMNPETLDLQEMEDISGALCFAIETENWEIVDKLLQSKFTARIINGEDSEGRTPLILAVLKKSAKLVSSILTAEADPNMEGKDGLTALMMAAREGQVDIVQLLINNDHLPADLTQQHKGSSKTALHFAAEAGHVAVVQQLVAKLDQTEDKTELRNYVATPDKNGKTAIDLAKTKEVATILKKALPLFQRVWKKFTRPLKSAYIESKLTNACIRGDIEQMEECFEKGADPNQIDARDVLRWTRLMRAAHNGRDEVVRVLLEHGARPNDKAAGGWTPLILASRKGYYKIVQHLVNHGADVSIQNWQGWTALMWASQAIGKQKTTEEALQNRIETAKIILEKDPSVVDIQTYKQWSPLMQASQDGNAGLVELLMSKGANSELNNQRNWVPMMIAIQFNRTKVVKALVQNGAKPDYRNEKDKMSPLHVAAVKGRDECLRIMLEPTTPGGKCTVDLDIKNKWGMTPLILAAKNGNKTSAKILVDNGADVNAESKEYAGWSPLFFAIKEGYLEIAKLLVTHKASMSTKDQNEQTPLGYAFSQKRDIFTGLISFLKGKPQVLKAITASGEATEEVTGHGRTVTLTPPEVEPEEGLELTPPIASTETTAVSVDTETKVTLDQLIEEAKTSVKSRVNIKETERKFQSYMTPAMQSGASAGRTSASAA